MGLSKLKKRKERNSSKYIKCDVKFTFKIALFKKSLHFLCIVLNDILTLWAQAIPRNISNNMNQIVGLSNEILDKQQIRHYTKHWQWERVHQKHTYSTQKQETACIRGKFRHARSHDHTLKGKQTGNVNNTEGERESLKGKPPTWWSYIRTTGRKLK